MNFTLYMLGRGTHAVGTRPDSRDLQAVIASAAAAGRWSTAVNASAQLARATGKPLDLLMTGHLQLLQRNAAAACDCITRAMEQLLDEVDGNSIENMLRHSDTLLADGKLDAAESMIQRTRSRVELLLAAQADLLLAGAADARAQLASLCNLSDLTLRMLARVNLARQLAGALKRRSLPVEYAATAASKTRVRTLLEAEMERLSHAATGSQGHAEAAYRLGLVARALGQSQVAATAFRNVLNFHPYHMASAARLAAGAVTESECISTDSVLRRAFNVPAETLRLFADFASSVRESGFDATAESVRLTRRDSVHANLAFALAELGLLDESRESWREAAPKPPTQPAPGVFLPQQG